MLLGDKKTLQDYIIEILFKKESDVSGILEQLKIKKTPATFQGIYKALRQLAIENIVIKRGNMYIVNNLWRNKLSELVSSNSIFQLSPGERMSYNFKRIDHTDAFWKHTWVLLEKEFENFPLTESIPHQFWLFLSNRKESEYEYYMALKQKKTMVFTAIGGTSVLDKKVKKVLTNEYHQVNTGTASLNTRDHKVIAGPYIITTRISKKIANAIDMLYQTLESESLLEEKLNFLFEKPKSVTLHVENNEKLAKKLRKTILKDFYVSRDMQEKFDLF